MLILYGILALKPAPQLSQTAPGETGPDLKNYLSIINRIHQGEGYYQAAGKELLASGYPSDSVFNWRPPLRAVFLGKLPSIYWGQVFISILSLMGVALWVVALRKEFGFSKTIFGGLLLLGNSIACLSKGNVFLAHEVWVGACITLSLGAYAHKKRYTAVVFGIFALLLRELTLPFTCIMCLAAFWEGHRREAAAWLMGMVAFGIMMLAHAIIISGLPDGGNPVHSASWLALGGWPFVINTARTHPYLFLLPAWVTAVILPLALCGLAGWRGPLGLRVDATVGVYVVAFLFVGRPFNIYWGYIFNNLVLIGLFFLPLTFRDLFASLSKQRS